MTPSDLLAFAREQLDSTDPTDGYLAANLLAQGIVELLGVQATDSRMWATLLSENKDPKRPLGFQPGDLVCVLVPLNCTIHSAHAAALARLRTAAACLVEHKKVHGDFLSPKARWVLDQLLVASEELGDTEEPVS